jgi:DNA-binding MarR family transcriptional regulator
MHSDLRPVAHRTMLHATLTIYSPRRTMDRQARIAEIIDQIGTPNPSDAMKAMRHWPGGRLSLVHLNVLFVMQAEGPMPMRALAESMDVSQASATGIVDRMEQRGLVERQRDGEDRRVVRVAITDEGRKLIAGMAQERREHLAQMLDQMTDEELDAFLVGAKAMRRVRAALHAGQDSHPGQGLHPRTEPEPGS